MMMATAKTKRKKMRKREGKEVDDEEPQEPLKLYPPGRLFVLHSDPPGCGMMPQTISEAPQQRQYGTFPTFEQSQKVSWVMNEADQEEFGEIVVSPWCISDHMPGMICVGIEAMQRRTKAMS